MRPRATEEEVDFILATLSDYLAFPVRFADDCDAPSRKPTLGA